MVGRILFVDGVVCDVPETLLHPLLLLVQLHLSPGESLSPLPQLLQSLHRLHHVYHLTRSTDNGGGVGLMVPLKHRPSPSTHV